MGLSQSHTTALTEQLQALVGPSKHNFEDVFWQRLFSFHFGPADLDMFEVHIMCRNLCEDMAKNNPSTHNFHQLIRHGIATLKATNAEMTSPPKDLLNKLFLIRIFVGWFVENLSNADLCLQFGTQNIEHFTSPPSGISKSLSFQFIQALSNFLIDVRVNEHSYTSHLEVATLLLMLLSTQLFRELEISQPACNHFLDLMLLPSEAIRLDGIQNSREDCCVPLRTGALTTRLLINSYQFPKIPTPSRSIFSRLVSSATSLVMFLPYQIYSFFFPESSSEKPLADTSLHILFALLFHRVENIPDQQHEYLTALSQAVNSDASGNPTTDIETATAGSSLSFSFSSIYDSICTSLPQRAAVLLAYTLIHRNHSFLEFCLGRTDLERLLLPLLKALYNPTQGGTGMDESYMQLIVLMILTHNSSLSAYARNQIVTDTAWLHDRFVHHPSLQSVTVIVLVKCVISMSNKRDAFFQSNCIGVLANTSSHFVDLHPHACHRLVSLLEVMFRSFIKQMNIEESKEKESDRTNPEQTAEESENSESFETDEDALCVVLEMFVNALRPTSIQNNSRLLLALMRRADLLETLSKLPDHRCASIAQRLIQIISHFRVKLEQIQNDPSSPEDILRHLRVFISNGAVPSIDYPQTTKLFTYVEDPNAQDFFVPFVWSIVFSNSRIVWRVANVRAFDPTVWLSPTILEDMDELEESFLLWNGIDAQQEISLNVPEGEQGDHTTPAEQAPQNIPQRTAVHDVSDQV
eukprot:c7950_g1_i1.p1 GENE.c7950_g1_i1~~c7950_g1_i1.p1  ORF type:complete len:750 (+),score=208.64 c7950_g1_i1:29-2278(+)